MDETRSIGRLISIINRTFSVYLNGQIKNPLIGIGQVRLVIYIKLHDGCCQRDISNHFMMDKGTTTSLLLNLEKNGFIRRKRNDADTRLKNIYLTETGIAFEEKIAVVLKKWSGFLLKGFSPEEQDASYKLLLKMVDNIAYLKDEKLEIKE